MPGPEVVAEEAPVALTFSLFLSSALEWVIAWGLLLLWGATLGYVLEQLANALKIDAWRIHIDPGAKLRDIDHYVRGVLQGAIGAGDLAMGYWWHQTARLQGWIADETWKIARDTLHFGEFVVHTYGPLLVKTALTVLFPWPKLYRVIDSEIEKLMPRVGKIAHGATAATEAELAKFRRGIDRKLVDQGLLIAALGVGLGAIAGGLAWPHPGGTLSLPKAWYGLTKRLARIEARLHKLEIGLAAAGVMSVYMANVFRVSPRCLRSGNIGRLMRHVCGVPSWLLDVLLLGVVESFIASDLCAFSNLLIKQATAIRPALMELVNVEDALIDCGDNMKPIVFKLPPASLPPLQGVSPLAA